MKNKINEKNEIILTNIGKKKLEEELDHLVNFERPKIIEAVSAARNQGDLKENADYDAARNRQGEIEYRIKEIKMILMNAKIVSESNNNDKIVGIGSKVTIKIENNKEEIYSIVGTIETDPINNKISNESPLGKALMNHKIGDIVSIKTKTNFYNLKIINIEKMNDL